MKARERARAERRGRVLDATPSEPVPALAQQLIDAQKFVSRGVPESDADRRYHEALAQTWELNEILRSGRWTARHDRELGNVRWIVLESGTGREDPSFPMARLTVSVLCADRLVYAAGQKDTADPPQLAEIDAASADLEAALAAFEHGPSPFRQEPFVGGARTRLGQLRTLRDAARRSAGTAKPGRPGRPRTQEPPPRDDRLPSGPSGPGLGPGQGERDYSAVLAAARRATRTGNLADLDSAIGEMSTLSRKLPAGHSAHVSVLTMLARMLNYRADRAGSRDDIPAAAETAIAAVRAAPPAAMREPAFLLCQLLGKMTTLDYRDGPFEAAESALSAALETASGDETRMLLNLGVGGARLGHATATGDTASLRAAAEAFAVAEPLLGEARTSPEWFGAGIQLLGWIVNTAMQGGADAGTVARVNRIADKLEDLLVREPEFARDLADQFPADPLPFPAGPLPFAADSEDPPALQLVRFMRETILLFSGNGMFSRLIRGNPQALDIVRALAAQSPFTPPAPQEPVKLTTRGLDVARDALRPDRPDPTLLQPSGGADEKKATMSALRAACSDLRAALAAGVDDDALRPEVHGTLGTCLARLHWLGEPDPPAGLPGRVTLLGSAIHHLEVALADGEHALPTPGRAALTDLLARCYRRSALRGERGDGKRQAELTAHAALRELARCVLVAASTADGLRLAANANEIVARSADWCLADERPAAAVAIAEAGRGLVLAASVLSGRVSQILEGEGEHDAARAWHGGGQQGRLAGLDALWRTPFGGSLLPAPEAAEVTAVPLAAGVDAVVYLVPPGGESPGRALICHAGTGGQVDELPLPGLRTGPGSRLASYQEAFDAALAGLVPVAWDPGEPDQRDPGAAGTLSRTWLGALDDLGAWAYEHIVGVLAERSAEWGTGGTPRLALVPLGELAGIPFAAAWTADATLPEGRRYAIHDFALSYAVSGRFLNEIARRPRRPLTDRVVLASTGNFPFARAGISALARHLYPRAEIYGLRNAPNGPASMDSLLAAVLPGAGQPTASLLHLTTHGTSEPAARLQTADGWLELSQLLREAHDRHLDETGGLVITNACLTGSTHGYFDESVTLATALLAAGASGVMGPRWPVHEDTSAMFTYYLHHHLARGHGAAQALRLAQLDMLTADPPHPPGQPPFMTGIGYRRRAHPASWAGYTYHGVLRPAGRPASPA